MVRRLWLCAMIDADALSDSSFTLMVTPWPVKKAGISPAAPLTLPRVDANRDAPPPPLLKSASGFAAAEKRARRSRTSKVASCAENLTDEFTTGCCVERRLLL